MRRSNRRLPPADHRELQRLALVGEPWRHWYRRAHADLLHVSRATGWGLHRLASVLAITSVRCVLSVNVRTTLRYLADGTVPYYTLGSTSAALAHYESTGHIRGRKTSSFARALLLDEAAIVLDTWMARALGIDTNAHILSTVWGVHAASHPIRALSYHLSWPAAHTQAAVWAGIRIHHGIRPSFYPLYRLYLETSTARST